jgi:uncharacterized GH25 family protein
MQIRLTLGALMVLFVLATSSFAHDYWLEPETFFPGEGKAIAVRLFMGEALKAEAERPLVRAKIERFTIFSGEAQRGLLLSGDDEKTPVARVVFSQGDHLIAMERKPQTIKIEADKFTRYLEDEGLASIVARRETLGESKAEGRERYSRYLKTFVRCGGKPDVSFRRVVGHRLEILPQSDPTAGKVGDPLEVRVLFEGKPLAGVRVFAETRDGEARVQTQSVSTDSEGRATFDRKWEGTWLIRLVHMQRATKGDEMDWESFWAAYTFGFPDPGRVKP